MLRPLAGIAARLPSAGAARADPARRPRRRPRRARPDAGAHLRRPDRLHRALRQAVRHRREAGHRAAARDRLRVVGRQQDADPEAAQRRHLPRRREVRRGRGQVQHRAPQDDGRLEPERRAAAGDQRRRRRPDDRQAQSVGAVHADPGRARRSRRHDGLAEGVEGRGRELRRPSGLLGAVQVRRAGRPGPDRVRALRGLLEQGQRPLRQGRLHADHRPDGAPRQPALGPVRHHRAGRAVRHREAEAGQEPEGRAHHRDRLPGDHDQRRQERAGAEEPARQGRQGARGLRALARSRRHRPRW